MNRQEFEDTARRYREEMFRMYASQSINPPPKPEPQSPLQSPAPPRQQNPPQSPAPPHPQNPPQPPAPPRQQTPPMLMPRAVAAAALNDTAPELPASDIQATAQQQKDGHSGIIRVHVTTALGARPIVGATVTITRMIDGQAHLISLQNTDESGEIVPVTVPAPPPSADQRKPESYIYDLSVQARGYYREHSADVPVFPGVTSVQNFDLIPLPAGTEDPMLGGDITYYNNMRQY